MLDHFEGLSKAVSYDPETGVFRWLVRQSTNRHVGDIAGNIKKDGYRHIGFCRKTILAHRLAWFIVHGHMPPSQVDHINRVRDDNRIENLRLAEPWQNSVNAPPRGALLKGVTRVGGRFQAQIRHQTKQRYLGLFATPEEAHAAYMRAATHLRGEFACAK